MNDLSQILRNNASWLKERGLPKASETCEKGAVEIERLRKVLQFYAEPRGTKDENGERISIPDFYEELEFGEYARRTLNT